MCCCMCVCMESYGRSFSSYSSHRIWWASPVVVVATNIPYWSTPQPVPPLIVPHHLLCTVQSLTWWVWNTILTRITKSACCSTFLLQSMPTSVTGAPFSPHEPSTVFQMGMAAAPPFSHDQQQKTSSKQPRNNAL